MHSEIQVALKFVISFLYNKLPRRRVNLFGEELENALRDKFQGHWYPDKPFKGSAYRCLKITDPADPVLNRAARESGNPITDIIENLPADLAVWIDPGEVSYRMGEKGAVKILFSEKEVQQGGNNGATAVDDLSPEVRGFLTLDTVTNSLNGLSLSSGGYGSSHSPVGGSAPGLALGGPISPPLLPGPPQSPPLQGQQGPGPYSSPAQQASQGPFSSPGQGPPGPYSARQPPVVYTAATFAQTKFGSTKLKTNSKKPNRMSPTEFSNYIKQRAMQKSLQQQNNGGYGQQQQQQQQQGGGGFYDKFYQGPSSPCYGGSGNSNSSNMNFNNFPKSLVSQSSGTGSNDYNNFGLNSGLTNNTSNGFANGLNLSDYSSLLSDWPDSVDQDTNAFLQDILSSAGVGGSVGAPTTKSTGGRSGLNNSLAGGSSYDEWMNGGVGLGFNANHASNETSNNGLGPESRSSSTKSMSSGSEHSLPSPPGLQSADVGRNGDGFGIHRVLVAN